MSAADDPHRLIAAFVDELVRCGVTDACTSPGSRSTPLVLALARHRGLRVHSHIDERASAFFALGIAKATGRAVAIACTSGTAAANFAPAVIEASQARVPLIVLTADRPPELREIGAGQTIDQIKLYGDAVRWFFEVGDHELSDERVAWIRALACRAHAAATAERPGPVHLNWPLRDPLVPTAQIGTPPGGRSDGRPWVVGRACGAKPPSPGRAHHCARARADRRGARRRAASHRRSRSSPRRRDTRCSPTRSQARGAVTARSPTTTRCSATRRSRAHTHPTS